MPVFIPSLLLSKATSPQESGPLGPSKTQLVRFIHPAPRLWVSEARPSHGAWGTDSLPASGPWVSPQEGTHVSRFHQMTHHRARSFGESSQRLAQEIQ